MKRSAFFLLCVLVTNSLSIAQKPGLTGVKNRPVKVYVTAEKTDFRLSPHPDLVFSPFGQPYETQPSIFIDTLKSYQTFIGIGGALTDASAETFAKLPGEKQDELLKAYFSPVEGIGYTIARTNINSCDFSSGSYTYVRDNDTELGSFDIAPDRNFKIPFIRKCTGAAGGKLPLFASPWSPPAWMKDNGSMLQGGLLLPEFYPSWAGYFVKFIDAYRKEDIAIWGITVQNEPMARQTWESCIYTADEERDFIKNHLGPALWEAGLKDVRLIAWDHNRDLVYHRASTILDDDEASKYVWGIGFHWYESWTGAPIYENIQRVAEAYPEIPLLLTEACNYPFSWETIDQWHWGEKYGEEMIRDFNNGAVAWTDWNILLDETGGPNHVGNFCFAPIHARTKEGTLHYMNSYYYIGHLSKFIRPGAKRIGCSSSRAQLLATAFRNTDGTIAVVVMNKQGTEVSFRMYMGNQAVEVVSLPHSIMTLVY